MTLASPTTLETETARAGSVQRFVRGHLSATLIFADCRDVNLEGDVMITDPPYGVGQYEETKSDVGVVQILQPWKRKAVFGYPEILVEWCCEMGKPDEWVTWWASNAMLKGFATRGLWREVEAIACYGKNRFHELRRPRSAFAEWVNESWTVVEKKGVNTRIKAKGKEKARLGDCWTDPSPHLGFTVKQRLHPNEKPLVLVARLVEGMSEPGETVCDPYMGSATTAAACLRTGRNFFGVERDPKHYATACGRMEKEVDGALI